MRLLLPVVLVTLALAGCFGGGTQKLSQEEAEDAAIDAMAAFAADFSSSDGGDLSKVSGSFSAAGDEQIFTGAEVTFTMEWGRDGEAFAEIDMSSGGASFAVSLYCADDVTVIVYGNDIIESRPTEGACLDAFGDGGDPLEVDEFTDLDLLDAEPQDDGGVIATFEDDNGTVTITIDPKGRVSRLAFDTPDGEGALDVSYGARRSIELPEATARMPVNIYGGGYLSNGVYEWSAFGEETAPFGEIEIRVVDPEDNVVATFTPGSDGEQAGFTFRYEDDGDGMFSGDDTFTISREGWQSESQYSVLLWDTWAEREVGDIPIPGIGVFALLAAIGIARMARR